MATIAENLRTLEAPRARRPAPAGAAGAWLTDEQVARARRRQLETREPLGTVLLELGFVDEHDVPQVLAALRGLEVADLSSEPIDPAAAARVPEALARRLRALPLRFEDGVLVVAVADPFNVLLVDDLRLATSAEIRLVVAAESDILASVGRAASLTAEEPVDEPDEAGPHDARVDDAPIVRLVHQIIGEAVQKRASDVHIEPDERDVRVRYRIDGVLHDVARLPRAHQAAVAARLKVMADANIAERRLPQDGRISVASEGRSIDLRLSTLPSSWGEDIVLRILDRSSSVVSLEELGYADDVRRTYDDAITRSQGLVLVAGPTGSGKSTTLYASLGRINVPGRKIITVEDPVEYRLDGLRQVQVHAEIGLTFARALRSILRADPDVVMVGEVRDPETASIAVQAAMTGHLVFATLHTNDSASAPTRLLDMGVPPFLVASALSCVVAQRLARRLCAHCSEPDDRDNPVAAALWPGGVPDGCRRAVGCRACAGTGFRGRVAVAEVMPCDEQVARLVAARAAVHEVRKVALAGGMRPLLEDGLAKAAAGVTTVDEVVRVVG